MYGTSVVERGGRKTHAERLVRMVRQEETVVPRGRGTDGRVRFVLSGRSEKEHCNTERVGEFV